MIIRLTTHLEEQIYINVEKIIYFSAYVPKGDEMTNERKKSFVYLGDRYFVVQDTFEEILEKIGKAYD